MRRGHPLLLVPLRCPADFGDLNTHGPVVPLETPEGLVACTWCFLNYANIILLQPIEATPQKVAVGQ